MFDLQLITEAAKEHGFSILLADEHQVEVNLINGYVLVFQNMEGEDDTSVFFKDGGGWHSHGDLFSSHYKTQVELVPVEILNDLKSGKMVISDQRFVNGNGILDISLVFADQIGDVNYYLAAGEKITFIKLI